MNQPCSVSFPVFSKWTKTHFAYFFAYFRSKSIKNIVIKIIIRIAMGNIIIISSSSIISIIISSVSSRSIFITTSSRSCIFSDRRIFVISGGSTSSCMNSNNNNNSSRWKLAQETHVPTTVKFVYLLNRLDVQNKRSIVSDWLVSVANQRARNLATRF